MLHVNLVVFFEEENHPHFVRDGENVFLEAVISFSMSALGTSIEVPTIDGGKVSLKIPPGIQSGQILRMRKKGFPVMRGSLPRRMVCPTLRPPKILPNISLPKTSPN